MIRDGLDVLWTLILKEARQLLRNRQVLALVVLPPLVQLVVFGVALNPDVRELPLAIVDESRTAQSRDLIAAFTDATGVFVLRSTPPSSRALADAVRNGTVAIGIVIPPDFAERMLQPGRRPSVQILADGVNSYVAGLGTGYAQQIVTAFTGRGPPLVVQPLYLFNPGLVSSWFFVPGIIGALLMLVSLLISAVEAIKEKETGTLEQLLMTPASSSTIIASKIVPLFGIMLVTFVLSALVANVGFGLPFRGSFAAFTLLSCLMIFGGVSLGMLISTITSTRRQAILTAIFIALPLILLSGALAPIESMPRFFQVATLLNPLRHYATIVRDVWLKGAGIDIYWPNALALLAFAAASMSISVALYRRQLS